MTLIALIAFLSAPAAVAQDNSQMSPEWRRSLFTFGMSASTYLISNFALELPRECKWCEPPNFDRNLSSSAIWSSNQSEASTFSDVVAFGFLPAVAGLVAFYEPKNKKDTLLNVMTLVNTTLLTYSMTEAVKRSTARKRPDISLAHVNEGDDEFMSFPSGHTSIAFALATTSTALAFKHHYSFAPFVLFFGALSGVATGYFRIAAEKHWFSDVITGAGVGLFVGSVVPLFTFADITPMQGGQGLTLSLNW